jgi:hypothetical protein
MTTSGWRRLALAMALHFGAALPVGAQPVVLSVVPDSGVDGDSASHSRIARLSYPAPSGFQHPLVVAYADGVGPSVWDHEGALHAANDIFVTRSLDDGRTWSTPKNLSGHATLSSIAVDDDGDPATPPVPYAGSADKPNLQANGRRVAMMWLSRYCPSGVQGTVRYPEAGNLEVPYACVWFASSLDGGASWSLPALITDGARDAKQEAMRATGRGFLATFQQDPRGLQPGEAEGPGEGGSGSRVSPGTDVWWSALPTGAFDAGSPLPPPGRLTDNATGVDAQGVETGVVGASRATPFLDGGTAVVVYEETKGKGQMGKYVRHHAFSAFDATLPDATAGAGCILSDPGENARRARVVAQPGPLQTSSELRVMVFWRQGTGHQGAPADIVGRIGSADPSEPSPAGLASTDLWPAVAEDCTGQTGATANHPPLNLSSDQGVEAATSDNPLENARAHRAVIRGDTVLLGWTRTPSLQGTPAYDFFVRPSRDGGRTWEAPVNLSLLPRNGLALSAAEPRLAPTPFSGDPDDVQDLGVAHAAWGSIVEPAPGSGLPAVALDLHVTRTVDSGATWRTPSLLAGGPDAQFETQMTSNANGDALYAVYQQEDGATGAVDTLFVRLDFSEVFSDGFETGDLSRWSLSRP